MENGNQCITECEKVFSLTPEAINMLEEASKDKTKSCSNLIDELVQLILTPLLPQHQPEAG